jgi:hypothetical protein
VKAVPAIVAVVDIFHFTRVRGSPTRRIVIIWYCRVSASWERLCIPVKYLAAAAALESRNELTVFTHELARSMRRDKILWYLMCLDCSGNSWCIRL